MSRIAPGMGASNGLISDPEIWRVVTFVSRIRTLPPAVDSAGNPGPAPVSDGREPVYRCGVRKIDMRNRRKRTVGAAIAFMAFWSTAGGLPADAAEESRPAIHELKLVYLFEGPEPEFVFVIGNSGFRSVASLKAFIVSLPPDTTLRWSPGCVRIGGEPLLSSEIDMEEFKAFCLDHRIDFVLVPSG